MSISRKLSKGCKAYFQLTKAAMTPKGSHLTSLYLYIMRKFVGLFSGLSDLSPCFIVHFSFSTVTSISPREASISVLPESRHATLAIVPWLSRMYLCRQSRQLPLSYLLQKGLNVLQHRFQYPPSLFVRCLCPFCLSLLGPGYCSVNPTGRGGVHKTQQSAIGRAVASYGSRARNLYNF